MSLLQVIILSVVQGLTEFLPVSSSGHLLVAATLLTSLGYSPPQDLIEVSIVLHLGTLLAVLVYYRRETLALLTSDRRVIPLLIVGTLPAAMLGIWIKSNESVERMLLEQPLLAGLMFLITARVLIRASHEHGQNQYSALTWPQALWVGVYQACALLPGVSRSGATIAGGIHVGLERRQAATFAFLLAIPAILGAGVLELREALEQEASSTSPGILLVGFICSFVVGLFALTVLIRFVERGRLALFAYYLVPLGLAVIVWQLAT